MKTKFKNKKKFYGNEWEDRKRVSHKKDKEYRRMKRQELAELQENHYIEEDRY